jgi:hypothetical protein
LRCALDRASRLDLCFSMLILYMPIGKTCQLVNLHGNNDVETGY